MEEVEVLISNFKDKENYNKVITIIRDGKEMKIQRELLQLGDRYKISKQRCKELEKVNIVKKITKEKSNKED